MPAGKNAGSSLRRSHLLLAFVLIGLAWMPSTGCVQPQRPTEKVGVRAASPDAGVTSVDPRTNQPLRFIVTVPALTRSNAVTGRVLLFLSRKPGSEPRFTSSFAAEPPALYAIDATNWSAGMPLTFWPSNFTAPAALAFPGPMGRLEPGAYRAQVLVDLHETRRDFNEGPGNLYSKVFPCQLYGNRGGPIELAADQEITEKAPKDNDWVKLVQVRSRLLSDFHHREMTMRAAVILPSTYTNSSDGKFPAIYVIPGFGGRHTSAWGWIESSAGKKWRQGGVPLQALYVMLDPDVPLGHSAFANSANNGPVGDALVQELIPEIERRFRALAHPTARFVTGHSSGGWASLWLQVAYPEFFGGCWSTAPDPVDFRAFQTVNLYEDRNGHWTREGTLRPVSRARDRAVLTFQQFNRVEYVLGPGGQLDSFNAVFSPRGKDGRPRPVMDKLSGHIDRDVVEYWKRYDIRLLLEENWPTLGPKLQDKLHVIGAAWDTYFLDPAVVLLQDFLRTQKHGGYVEIHPGDHGSVMTEPLRERIAREMAQRFEATAEQRK